ncbi:MAG: hypothetical protein OEW75_12685 [Cyclobacteriaceae bacterium]|nr:hypothetical protein [Cyclobacteriaceae bacterium]
MALKDPYLTDKIDSTELSEKIDGLRRLTKDNRGVIFSNMIILKEQRKRIEWWLK